MKLTKTVWIYLILVLYTVAPIICVLISAGLASLFHCRVDESGAHPCMAGGVDIGGLLVNLFVSGWLMLLTIPTGLTALTAYTVALVIAKNKKRP